ncbi:RusA family crossover junction endodeoxyribonuclease [Heyndrickxia oleronia]|uniref:RusA family crossover junction endodeoxyribonuclease n=1 Tax=Heyndrickxia oleronia TaxID=38875 RepID=UPI00203B7579|nr:RusA family crossover junction endodeoxyribonuclease [Heyndrickxia oleronia]MCM3452767.1 RusA family crossover junction endodeoxyribonuclease [Heyndrickxia oleronia]
MIRLKIPIDPMGAVRMTTRGKYIKANAQRYLMYKERIQWLARKQLKNKTPFAGPVEVRIWFNMPIPKSWSKKKQNEAYGEYHTKKPDTDNLLKGVFDSLNKIAWQDDNQVAKVIATKIYAEKSGIEIEIKQLS